MTAWQWGWYLGVYVAVFCCLWAIVKIWRKDGWKAGVGNVLAFVFFAVLFWMFESYASVRAPFYTYPPQGSYARIFPDLLPAFPIGGSSAILGHICEQVPWLYISATVPLSAAVICFCLMWTARLLLDNFWLSPYRPVIAPLMVGIIALGLDLYLDPVLSSTHHCTPNSDGSTTYPLLQGGLDYWRWFADAQLGNFWFGIPLFNFAAWFAAPVTLVSFVVLFAWLAAPTSMQDLALRAAMALGFEIVLFTSPLKNTPDAQIAVVVVSVLIASVIIIRDWSTYKRNNPFHWEFVLPLLFYFFYPLLALVFSAAVPFTPLLLVAALAFTALGIVFVFSPYWSWP